MPKPAEVRRSAPYNIDTIIMHMGVCSKSWYPKTALTPLFREPCPPQQNRDREYDHVFACIFRTEGLHEDYFGNIASKIIQTRKWKHSPKSFYTMPDSGNTSEGGPRWDPGRLAFRQPFANLSRISRLHLFLLNSCFMRGCEGVSVPFLSFMNATVTAKQEYYITYIYLQHPLIHKLLPCFICACFMDFSSFHNNCSFDQKTLEAIYIIYIICIYSMIWCDTPTCPNHPWLISIHTPSHVKFTPASTRSSSIERARGLRDAQSIVDTSWEPCS